MGGRAKEFSIGRRCSTDSPGTTDPDKLWDWGWGVEFPPCLSCFMGDSAGREGEFGYYNYSTCYRLQALVYWCRATQAALLLTTGSGGTPADQFYVPLLWLVRDVVKGKNCLMWPKPDPATKIWHLYVCVVKCYSEKELPYAAGCFIVLNMRPPQKTVSVLAECNPNQRQEHL